MLCHVKFIFIGAKIIVLYVFVRIIPQREKVCLQRLGQEPDSNAAKRLDAVIVKGSWRVYFFGKGCTGDKALGN